MEPNSLEALLKEHLAQDQSRLDRIEIKIDKLSETVVAIARAEEKLLNLEASKKELWQTVEEHEKRIDEHELRLNSGSVTLNTITRLFWILIAASAAGLVSIWTM